MTDETSVRIPLYTDRSQALGQSTDADGRRALHVKIKNLSTEPMPISSDAVANTGYVGDKIDVGTSRVEAKVGATRLAGRKLLYLENRSTRIIYYGPSNLTVDNGATLYPNQALTIENIGGDIVVYVISAYADAFCIVQEFA